MAIRGIIVFFLSFLTMFGQVKSLESIKDIQLDVVEKVVLENKPREKEYQIKLILPNLLLKKITAPKLNAGEIYLYKDGKRFVYLPIFDEITEEKSDKDTNYFLDTIKVLINKEKNDPKFKASYAKGEIKTLTYESGLKTNLLKYEKVDGYLLPTLIDVYDGQIKVATLVLKNIKINGGLKSKDFDIKNELNKK